jgi:DNA polymerase-4
MSIDEAYLEFDSDSIARDTPDPDDALRAALPIAVELKRNILDERRLTATIGIGANKLLAKLASDFKKPDGLTLIPEREKMQFLRPMPVRALHGVGRVTEEILSQAGIRTIADLQEYPGDLRALVGSFAARLRSFAFGEDDRPLDPGRPHQKHQQRRNFCA